MSELRYDTLRRDDPAPARADLRVPVRFVAAGEVRSGTLTNPAEPEAAAAALRDA